MTVHPLQAMQRLADLLATENAALEALDLRRAALLANEKAASLEAFAATRAQALTPRDHEAASRLLEKLNLLADENRRLLIRALRVQERIMGLFARAAPRVAARNAPRYGANGRAHPAQLSTPMAISARI